MNESTFAQLQSKVLFANFKKTLITLWLLQFGGAYSADQIVRDIEKRSD